MSGRYEAKTYDGLQWFVRDTILGYNGGPYPGKRAAEQATRELNRADKPPRRKKGAKP
jgi:hypothetical protein